MTALWGQEAGELGCVHIARRMMIEEWRVGTPAREVEEKINHVNNKPPS
jgi:hypothetical protein